MITSMRRCVAYNDLWPWPISSRSFGFDLENRVLSVASTVLDGFFPYVVQMITSMRCVACDDLWPWPISSRSFGLDLENRVLSVASTVLDGFSPYLVQMNSSMRRCVACDDLWPWPISSRSFDHDFENRVRSVTFSVLDRLFFWLGIQYDSIMWVIMRRRGVSSERRRSSYSSFCLDLAQCNACLVSNIVTHDVIARKHFQHYWPFMRGIHWSPVDSPHKGQWHRALMFPLICAWTNSWGNNRDAFDLRHHCTHCDSTVMWWLGHH